MFSMLMYRLVRWGMSSLWVRRGGSSTTVQKVLQREERMYPARPDGQLADVLRGKTLEEIDRLAVQLALSECGGSQKATAARLGISRTTLWRMLQKQPGEES